MILRMRKIQTQSGLVHCEILTSKKRSKSRTVSRKAAISSTTISIPSVSETSSENYGKLLGKLWTKLEWKRVPSLILARSSRFTRRSFGAHSTICPPLRPRQRPLGKLWVLFPTACKFAPQCIHKLSTKGHVRKSCIVCKHFPTVRLRNLAARCVGMKKVGELIFTSS